MSTVYISRVEALNQGELYDLSEKTKEAGWPLDLAITRQAYQACLNGQDEEAIQKFLDDIETVLVMALILHTPPRRALHMNYRSCIERNNSLQEVSLALRVCFTEDGMPCSATLGLRDEKLCC